MKRRAPLAAATSPTDRLEAAVTQALHVAKKARKHHQSLSGDNFYSNKLSELRADATNAFRNLVSQSAGDVTAMAELMELVFSPDTNQKKRLSTSRELLFSLKTTWREQSSASTPESEGLFPLSILVQTNRGYLTTIGRQMNGCYSAGWYDASSVMMRRLVEIAIIEAFEHKGNADKIKSADGNYLHLSELVQRAIAETSWTLSRNAKKGLPHLRDVGHMSAHGRHFLARKEDLERVQLGCRVVVEEFLHHAGLL